MNPQDSREQPVEAPKKVHLDVLERLLDAHCAFYVDWARLNTYSPDYDADYTVDLPEIVKEATAALRELRRIQCP